MDKKSDIPGFSPEELAEYDNHVKFYYTNIINAIILFTYNVEQLDEMAPILIDPLTELYEELDYAFTYVLFETVFRNNLIDGKYKEDLRTFKTKVDSIPNEIWDWKFIDHHENWISIRTDANELLNKIGIDTRIYNDEFVTIALAFNKDLKNKVPESLESKNNFFTKLFKNKNTK